jgi:hypothetical protein
MHLPSQNYWQSMDEFGKGKLREDKAITIAEIHRGARSSSKEEYRRCYRLSWKNSDPQQGVERAFLILLHIQWFSELD